MLSYGMGMDIQVGLAPNNFNKVRGKTLSSNRNISRNISISSTKPSVIYHKKMTINNIFNNDDLVDASPELSYETEQEKALHVSKIADQQDPIRPIGSNSEASLIHGIHEKSIINI